MLRKVSRSRRGKTKPLPRRLQGTKQLGQAIYVGRDSHWSNHFDNPGQSAEDQKWLAYRSYFDWLKVLISSGLFNPEELIGRDLVCECETKSEICHADLLMAGCRALEYVRSNESNWKFERLLRQPPANDCDEVTFLVMVWERARIERLNSLRQNLRDRTNLADEAVDELMAAIEDEDD